MLYCSSLAQLQTLLEVIVEHHTVVVTSLFHCVVMIAAWNQDQLLVFARAHIVQLLGHPRRHEVVNVPMHKQHGRLELASAHKVVPVQLEQHSFQLRRMGQEREHHVGHVPDPRETRLDDCTDKQVLALLLLV